MSDMQHNRETQLNANSDDTSLDLNDTDVGEANQRFSYPGIEETGSEKKVPQGSDAASLSSDDSSQSAEIRILVRNAIQRYREQKMEAPQNSTETKGFAVSHRVRDEKQVPRRTEESPQSNTEMIDFDDRKPPARIRSVRDHLGPSITAKQQESPPSHSATMDNDDRKLPARIIPAGNSMDPGILTRREASFPDESEHQSPRKKAKKVDHRSAVGRGRRETNEAFGRTEEGESEASVTGPTEGEAEDAATARKREQSRLNTAKYREKKKYVKSSLESDIARLEVLIAEQLELRARQKAKLEIIWQMILYSLLSDLPQLVAALASSQPSPREDRSLSHHESFSQEQRTDFHRET